MTEAAKTGKEKSASDLAAENAALRAKLGEMEAARSGPLTFKVSAKGGVSVYGLQRYPVTLYAKQWDRLHAAMPALGEFIAEHTAELAEKPVA